MALQYDFDLGPAPQNASNRRAAMFRDPKTVAALKAADPAVQTLFVDSGFALQVFESGAPPGRFPKQDEAARIEVITRLSKNFTQHPPQGANWGDFDFPTFMRAVGDATALEDDRLLAPTSRRASIDPEFVVARNASRRMRRRRKIAIGGLLLGLILLLFVVGQLLM